MVRALWRFWELRGHWEEGVRWAEKFFASDQRAAMLDAAGNLVVCQGDYARAHRLFEEQLALATDDRATADALHNLWLVDCRRGDYDQARRREEKTLALRRQLDDRAGVAASLLALGLVAHEQKDYRQATAFYEEALALRRSLGDLASIATLDRKSTRLNSSHVSESRMPSSA